MSRFCEEKISYCKINGSAAEFELIMGFCQLLPSGQAFVRVAENGIN